jgi:hypothetical protein
MAIAQMAEIDPAGLIVAQISCPDTAVDAWLLPAGHQLVPRPDHVIARQSWRYADGEWLLDA